MLAELYQQFKISAEKVSAQVHRAGNREEALTLIAQLLEEWEGTKEGKPLEVVWKKGPLTTGLDFRSSIKGKVHVEELERFSVDADVGIAEAEWGIADTGTLMQDATDVAIRYVTTLPELNILLVATENLVANMEEALAQGKPGQTPFLAFITGPSRTADIERVLTLGVHGPEWLHVICVDKGGC